MMVIEIDSGSGFCNGVTRAIKAAETELENSDSLYCLGDIVHNGRECDRLKDLGLITVDKAHLCDIHDTKLLLRAHGEPPSTYLQAKEQNIEIIDATCPVVLNLQKRIRTAYEASLSETENHTQIVIYGKNGHAEVVGLVGQTDGTAIVIESMDDARKLDFNHNIQLYSQTTKSLDGFREIVDYIQSHMQGDAVFCYFDTICRQVANRMSHIRDFAESHDVILFVSGKKSSNGKVLFGECLKVNPLSYLIDDANEIDFSWFENAKSVGICGATSTPKWLMENCRTVIMNKLGC
ncbi:MAG: 4-hydroxy-3-methylbut-2-enyl diphosphate reductase [Bacteroidaceae bacterium]|nr:4-hydroxy-3-methylbut-2-enyl diphosphate reductase [Bacteroidaceae bacterium]